MIKIRIGKDIDIVWPIRINETDVDVASLKLSLIIEDLFGNTQDLPFTSDGSILSAKWLGVNQKFLGPHTISLWLNRGVQGQTVTDVCRFVTLVSRTCVEESEPPTTIRLPTGVIWVGVKGDPGKSFSYEDFTEDQIKQLQSPATEAAEECTKVTKEAEKLVEELSNFTSEYIKFENLGNL